MKSRRRKRFVDSAVQGALARRTILHWLIFLAMACVTLPLVRIWSSGDLFSPFSTLFAKSWAETSPVFVVLLAMLPIFVWDTVTLSHRFAGPMYRFQKTVRSLVAGEEVRPIRLRKGDFWTGFADDLNTLIDRLAVERTPDAAEDAETVVFAAAPDSVDSER